MSLGDDNNEDMIQFVCGRDLGKILIEFVPLAGRI
jgi:hypothetical protein